VLDSVKPRPEANFGQKDFCLDQSRTSEQLAAAKKLDPKAHYCGIWYVHRTPTGELTDEEWVQAQGVLEDPDYRFDDLVCLVICLYSGQLNIYALSFNQFHSARGQLPAPTVLRSTTESSSTQSRSTSAPPAPSVAWFKASDIAGRLNAEHKWLTQKYRVESAMTNGKVVFRLMPLEEHQDMVFYISCEAGFPDTPPTAFLSIRGDRYPLVSPCLNEWSAHQSSLVKVADSLVKWQVSMLGQQMATAKEAMERGDYKQASDLLVMVLLINPRMPRAARLLAQVESLAGSE
jgi:hypothetical protein